jgi:hypothetical protein
MVIGTVRNCIKSTKLFRDMADLQILWAKIAGVKSINRALKLKFYDLTVIG